MDERPSDHPRDRDHRYLHRRQQVSDLSIGWLPGDPIPTVEYTERENSVWAEVRTASRRSHRCHAIRELEEGAEQLELPAEHIPQLGDLGPRLEKLSGFGLRPVPGLVPPRTFYGSLADLSFMATQHVRDPFNPMYSSEPDVIHDLIGHISLLASPIFAELHYLAGRASRRCTTAESFEFFDRIHWFTLEFGVVETKGGLRAYGAELCSSMGELATFRSADVRPFDFAQMGSLDHYVSRFQPVLFAAPSIGWLHQHLGEFLDSFSAEVYEREFAGAINATT